MAKKAKNNEVDGDLTEEQLKELDDAIKEADEGKTISYVEFGKNMDELITKLKSQKFDNQRRS